MTAVETSPISAMRAYSCRCSATPGSGAVRCRRSTTPTASSSAGSAARVAHQEHADAAIRLRRHARARDADQRAARRGASAESMSGRNGARPRARQMLRAIREHERFCLTTHERPDGDAVGSLAAMQLVLAALGKDAVAFMPRGRVPAAVRVPLHPARRADDRAAARPLRAHAGLPGLRQHRPHAGRGAQARGPTADPQHRPPPRQHALRDDQPRRPARVVHGRDGVGPDARPRRADHAADRRGALRRPGDRHGPLHVREHRPAGARDGRRADRARASTRTRSTGSSTRASRRASSSCWRAGSANVERFDGGLLTVTHLTRDDYRSRAPTRATPRASSTTCAPSRAPPSPGWSATSSTAEPAARSRCARPTTASTCR